MKSIIFSTGVGQFSFSTKKANEVKALEQFRRLAETTSQKYVDSGKNLATTQQFFINGGQEVTSKYLESGMSTTGIAKLMTPALGPMADFAAKQTFEKFFKDPKKILEGANLNLLCESFFEAGEAYYLNNNKEEALDRIADGLARSAFDDLLA